MQNEHELALNDHDSSKEQRNPTSPVAASMPIGVDGSSQQTQEGEDSNGQVITGSNETTYVGATHWAAILSDVMMFSLAKYISR